MKTYTCIGPVVGACGIDHRTIEAACRCVERKARAIRIAYRGGAYSDRRIVAMAGGREVDLTDAEYDAARRVGAVL